MLWHSLSNQPNFRQRSYRSAKSFRAAYLRVTEDFIFPFFAAHKRYQMKKNIRHCVSKTIKTMNVVTTRRLGILFESNLPTIAKKGRT